MLTTMIIVLTAMVVLGGAGLAFSFRAEEEPPRAGAEQQPRVPVQIFFQPTGWSRDLKQVSVDELVAGIEQHLRNERAAAAAFARDPSARTLWVD